MGTAPLDRQDPNMDPNIFTGKGHEAAETTKENQGIPQPGVGASSPAVVSDKILDEQGIMILMSDQMEQSEFIPKPSKDYVTRLRVALEKSGQTFSKDAAQNLNKLIAEIKPPALQAKLKALMNQETLGKLEDIGTGDQQLLITPELKDALAKELGHDFVSVADLPKGFLAEPPVGLSPKTAAMLQNFVELTALKGMVEGQANLLTGAEQFLASTPKPATPTESTPTPDQQAKLLADIAATGKPLPAGNIDPATSGKFQNVQMLSNFVSSVENNMVGLEKAIANMSGPDKMAAGEFLKIISDLLKDAKDMVRLIASKEGVQGKKAVLAQKEKMMNKIEKAAQERAEAAKKAKKQKILGIVFKVFMPIIVIVTVALAILDGGATLALTITAIISVSAMIADSASGGGFSKAMMTAFKAIFDGISKLAEKMGLPKVLGKIIAAVVMVAVLIAIAVAARSMLAKLGTSLLGMGAKEAGKFATGLTLMLAGTFTAMAQPITHIIKEMAIAFGVDENDMILNILASIINMITSLIAMIMGGGMAQGAGISTKLSKMMGDTAKNVAQGLMAGSAIAQGASGIYTGVNQIQQAQMTENIGNLQAAIRELEGQLEQLGMEKESINEAIKSLTEIAQMFGDTFIQMIQGYSKSVAGLTQA